MSVPHFGGLAEEDLVLVADKDAVQDELVDGGVSEVPERRVLAHSREQLEALGFHRAPVGEVRRGRLSSLTHKHTDTQTHRHTNTQTHKHTDTQTQP